MFVPKNNVETQFTQNKAKCDRHLKGELYKKIK